MRNKSGIHKTYMDVITRAKYTPWFFAKLCNLVKIRDSAFKLKDKEAYTRARVNLLRAIKET